MPSPVKKLFQRIDRNGDGSINRAEAERFAKDAKVNSGLFAGRKLKGAVDQMMDSFDGNRNANISLAEFESSAAKMLPPGLDINRAEARANPASVLQTVQNYVGRLDRNGDGKLSQKELTREFEDYLRGKGTSHVGIKATVSAQIAIHSLGGADKKISVGELSAFARAAFGIGG